MWVCALQFAKFFDSSTVECNTYDACYVSTVCTHGDPSKSDHAHWRCIGIHVVGRESDRVCSQSMQAVLTRTCTLEEASHSQEAA